MLYFRIIQHYFSIFIRTYWLYLPFLLGCLLSIYLCYSFLFESISRYTKSFDLIQIHTSTIITFHYPIVMICHLFILPIVYLWDYTERLSQGEQRFSFLAISFKNLFFGRFLFLVLCVFIYFVFNFLVFNILFGIREGFIAYNFTNYFWVSLQIFISFLGYLALITLFSFAFRQFYYGILQVILGAFLIWTNIDLLPFTFSFSLLFDANAVVKYKVDLFSPHISYRYTLQSMMWCVGVFWFVSTFEQKIFQNYLQKK